MALSRMSWVVSSRVARVCSSRYYATEAGGKTIVITGGAGNLGTKLATSLMKNSGEYEVHVIDPWEPKSPVPGVSYHKFDMIKREEGWTKYLDNAFALVHFAAINPYPEATWDESYQSMILTSNVFSEAHLRKTRRVIFSSSNHVMGSYKEAGGAYMHDNGENEIFGKSPIRLGTKHDSAGIWMDSTGYASAKLAGEAIAESYASLDSCSTQFFSVRVGWCQPGENTTSTMSITGTPSIEIEDEENFEVDPELKGNSLYDPDMILDWYRNMWLSNRDFVQLMSKAISEPLPKGSPKHIILHGMSGNTGMRWHLDDVRQLLGYEPQDDANKDANSTKK
eukprot:m.341192 g.341192  ORF g.341192 m.341192 type:complete len:337 (+) comp19892_c0_seq1:85-1095(+)